MSPASTTRRTFFLTLVTLVGVAAIVVMATLQYRAITAYRALGEMKVLASDIKSNLLSLRRNEKDFLIRKDLRYQRGFEHDFDALEADVQRLGQDLISNGLDDTKVGLLRDSIANYGSHFQQMVQLQQQIGFHHEDGYYGSMRKAIHRAEKMLQTLRQERLLKDMLMLRRHEKDFMLRGLATYLEKFDSEMAIMRADLNRAYIGPRTKREILSALSAYEADFKALASATREMGLISDDSLHQEAHKSIQSSEEVLGELRRYILLEESNAGSSMINQLIASAVVLTIIVTTLIRL